MPSTPLIACFLFVNELAKKLDSVTLKAAKWSKLQLQPTVICIANVSRQEAVAFRIGPKAFGY
jgi:hypothetical protein